MKKELKRELPIDNPISSSKVLTCWLLHPSPFLRLTRRFIHCLWSDPRFLHLVYHGPEMSHVTTIGEGAALTVDAPLRSEAAEGVLDEPPQPKRMSDARQSGMVATVALLIMFALVALMVWIGG